MPEGPSTKPDRIRGRNITEARFPLDRFREHGFVGITVVGELGGRVWSNPICLDE